MAHVAKEMDREGFDLPLLIGGATTSRMHTAVKIAPGYRHDTVYVPDASRASGVVGSLLSAGLRGPFVARNQRDQERARESHRNKRTHAPLLPLDEARQRRSPIEWRDEEIARPEFFGVHTLRCFPLAEIIPYIDWSPLFHTWELRGHYPQILEDAEVGERARELFADARELLERIAHERLLEARAVYGFFPANSVGDDIEVYADPGRQHVRTILHTLRQQTDKTADPYHRALADFVAPRETGLPDSIGAFAVTAGIGIEKLIQAFERKHDDYRAIMCEALADRLAEAFTELLHHRARGEWGYGKGENLTLEELLREHYRGIRPAPGYAACPDHTEKRLLFDLLGAEDQVGMKLTESYAMIPGSSVCGMFLAHPESRYFAVGKIGRDQVQDYARRKGMPESEAERWLETILDYEIA
jgi:5-methyltetrahydrofolate--homocysteine methyltransferase